MKIHSKSGRTHPGGAAAAPLVQGLTRRRWLQGAAAAPWLGALSGCDWWFGSSNDTDHNYRATIADGRSAIRAAMAQSGTPSVSVALQDNGVIVWEEAFGVTNRETGAAATVDTLYNIGSCSKVVVTAAIMILVDRGLVALDTPVIRYLPGWQMADPRYANITVRMLLNHSSGLPGTNERNIFTFRAVPHYEEQTLAALASLDLKAAPGQFSVYCNDGFTVAQHVVAEVANLSYPEFVRQEILNPLGMWRSQFALEPLPEGSFGHPYHNGVRQGQEYVQAYGTGGLISTPQEMMHWPPCFSMRACLKVCVCCRPSRCAPWHKIKPPANPGTRFRNCSSVWAGTAWRRPVCKPRACAAGRRTAARRSMAVIFS